MAPSRKAIEARQIEKLSRMLAAELPGNAFYRRKRLTAGFIVRI